MTPIYSFALTAVLSAFPPPEATGERALADLIFTVKACQRLQQDEVLAPHSVGVRVRNRIAILWGPVPSVEVALRAEAKLRAMIEFVDVRNELIVMADDWRESGTPRVVPPLR
jgi:hypothetical protein